jgi:hypothetical protein
MSDLSMHSIAHDLFRGINGYSEIITNCLDFFSFVFVTPELIGKERLVVFRNIAKRVLGGVDQLIIGKFGRAVTIVLLLALLVLGYLLEYWLLPSMMQVFDQPPKLLNDATMKHTVWLVILLFSILIAGGVLLVLLGSFLLVASITVGLLFILGRYEVGRIMLFSGARRFVISRALGVMHGAMGL